MSSRKKKPPWSAANRQPIAKPLETQKRVNDLYTKEELISLNKRSVSEITNDLSYEVKKFQCTLENTDICIKSFDIVISLLCKVSQGLSQTGEISRNATLILAEVMSERCHVFHSQMRLYVGGLTMKRTDNTEKNLLSMCEFFELLFDKLPDTSSNILPVSELHSTVKMYADSGFLKNNELLLKVRHLLQQHKEIKNQQRVSIIRSNCVASPRRTWDNSEYQSIQIFPKWEEISNPRPPFQLRPNIVKGSYDDWMHYYDIQFRLLREDFISPLRKGISDIKKRKTGRDVRNVKVYNNVEIERFKFTLSGVCHRIKFDVTPFRHYRWDHSKRLIFGSLLCLSPDNFTEKVFFATVVNREQVAQGYLDVMFDGCCELLTHINEETVFVMVESLAYFEASRHILQSLKVAECGSMPFTSYLISNDYDHEKVKAPRYLNATSTYDIQFIIKHEDPRYEVPQAFKKVAATNFSQWPTIEMTELDSSQLTALKMALTQEISVIQGPPGTGKTYIGLKIMQALLKNRHIWNPASLDQTHTCRVSSRFSDKPNLSSPILVMCFTNHALDQFLGGILEMHDSKELRLIRIGGRSKNEQIQECNLNKYKRSLRNIPKSEFEESKQLNAEVEEEGRKLDQSMHKYEVPRKFIAFSEIKCVIEGHLLRSLLDPTETKEEEHLALEVWLGLYDLQEDYFGDEDFPDENAVYEEHSQNKSLSSDEDSSTGDEDSSSEEETFNRDHTLSGEEATIDVTGDAFIEEDTRMIDGETEMYKEIKFSSHDTPPLVTNKKATKSEKPNLRRITKIVKFKNQHLLRKRIMEQSEMSKREVRKIRNVHKLSLVDRCRLYKYWHSKYNADLVQNLEEEFEEYNELCEKANRARHATDKYALETADVIGMTTTGAAKYQHILHLVKPKIVIVEEAAEVFESHIVSALNAGTQHLILIGDHKQLRPTPNEYDLVVKYKLDISLFERLVVNNFPHATLEIQHRMRPEISDIVKHHVYDNRLRDHHSVTTYPEVRGVNGNLFFINHSHFESANDLSHSNEHEADFLVEFCSYLLRQNYSPSQITILVAYTGQLLLMKRKMPIEKFDGVRLTTVDNFQGEENDIILLSVVRSNRQGSVGFLSTENRVCVALSRARHGLYCIGNFQMLRENAQIWDEIISDMEKKGKLGDYLPICCSKHPQTSLRIKSPDDFAKSHCQEPCKDRLDCGHVCRQKCHTTDPNHKAYKCKQECLKECPEGHPCRHFCYLPCECREIVSKTIPKCGHQQQMRCSQDPKFTPCYTKCVKVIPKCEHSKEMFCHESPAAATCREKCTKIIPKCGHSQIMDCYMNPSSSYVKCQSDCEKTCPEGHLCHLRCHERCIPCTVRSIVKLPDCGHNQEKFCHEKISQVRCMSACDKKCESGHPCPLKCYQGCRPCRVPTEVKMPVCGHKQKKQCHQHISEVKCKASCEKRCASGHPCKYKCYDHYVQPQGKVHRGCGDCQTWVKKTLKCDHIKEVACSVDASTLKCTAPCSKDLSCGHKCPLLCYLPCSTAICIQNVKVTLSECGHTAQVMCHQSKSHIRCKKSCQKRLPCGHKCREKCGDPCTQKCEVADVKRTCEQGHTLLRKCSETLDLYPCDKKCEKRLKCGHRCRKLCHQKCITESECTRLVVKEYPCGHKHRLCCFTRIEDQPCDFICKAPLACGHSCRGLCSECHSKHIHKPCQYFARQEHFCGKVIKMKCVGLKDSHSLKVDAPASKRRSRFDESLQKILQCKHREVPYNCKAELYKCQKPCQWNCTHFKCTKLCHEQCDRQPCNQKCPKRMDCGHKCIGLCGEPCITICPVCEPDEFESRLILPDSFSSKLVYTQLPCGDIFSVKDMNEHVRKHQSSGVIGPLQCPECYSLLNYSYRYGNFMKESLLHVDSVKTLVKSKMEEPQLCLPADKKDHLLRIFRFSLSDCSESQLQANYGDVLLEPFKFMLNIIMKKRLSSFGPRVSREKGFLFFLLAKVFKFALFDAHSIYDYQPMLNILVAMINNERCALSFQIILDLSSELYKLCIQAKLSACHRSIDRKRKQEFLDKHHERPLSTLLQRDFIPFSQLLDKELRKQRITAFESTQEFVEAVECFYPVILNGSWRKCDVGHYFCIPVCEPESLTMQCPQCTGGSYVECVTVNPVRKTKTPQVDIAQEREKFLAGMKAKKEETKGGFGGSAAVPKKKSKRRKKKK